MEIKRAASFSNSLKVKSIGVIAAVALICCVVFSLYRVERMENIERLERENRDVLSFSDELVRTYLGAVVEDLLVVSASNTLRAYLAQATDTTHADFLQYLRNLSIHKSEYAQLRYLDAEGMERVRVDSGGQVVVDDALQDKSNRYYFLEGMRVDAGTIYISPIDLNVENGEVQLPRTPMIRFVLPIDDPDQGRLGVMVLNFNARKLLERLRSMSHEAESSVELINADGYWMLHPNRAKEWGFMFTEGSAITMAEAQPFFWQQVLQQPAGMYEDAQGAVFWKKIQIENAIDIRYKAGAEDASQFWVMALRYDAEYWEELFQPIVSKYSILAVFPLFLGIAVIVYFMLRERYTKKIDALNQLNADILENAQVAVISTDKDGLVTSFNEFAQTLSGWRAEELVGQQSVMVFYESFEIAARAQQLSEATGSPVATDFSVFALASLEQGRDVREWIFTRKDGSKIPVITAVSVIRDGAGEVSGHLLVVVDISKQKRVEGALLEAREHAEALVKMKSQFLANMSHEIRTPMNGVVGLANLLISSDLNFEQRKLVETLVRSADTLMVVINDILDFSKIEAGALALEEASFDLRESIDNTLVLFAAEADSKEIELINRTAPEVDFALWGDSHRVTQVLSNLVGNAVKFTSSGGEIILSVRSSRVSEDLIMVHFEVSDTGIGMDAATKDKIFQPFMQADASTTRKFGGTGLGLAITTQLVEMMRGSIAVESELGVGTKFMIDIPFSPDFKNAQNYTAILDRSAFQDKRALVVDDNLTNLLVIQGQLSNLGFKVKTFESANSAYLEFVNDPDYDLLVLDYLMPEVDGLELARRLKSRRSGGSSKLVMLSSSQVVINQQQREEAGIDVYLTKPISQRELHAALRDQLLLGSVSAAKPLNSAAEIKERLSERLDGRELHLILVDDNATNRMVMGLQFRSIGLNIVTVEDAKELFLRLETSSFDVVLMDCNMPEMDGFEATKIIRQREAEGSYSGEPLWIIAATAFAFEDDRDKCIEVGMNDYVSKPARLPELAQAIERAIIARL
ncbi:response regulator [Coraliomargarita sp. SDUM461004]|uniref:histidine kinase n=1 Tax=Thalassobacterium sedimentorum TaxID=3041258 RepID=A0ABU1AI26_9BACT|nr:response regulator [Coraliomargarita sp. SDUM461004]MDQ8194465.1 response regulator [Coraliomargarita sp. SDUM461004]